MPRARAVSVLSHPLPSLSHAYEPDRPEAAAGRSAHHCVDGYTIHLLAGGFDFLGRADRAVSRSYASICADTWADPPCPFEHGAVEDNARRATVEGLWQVSAVKTRRPGGRAVGPLAKPHHRHQVHQRAHPGDRRYPGHRRCADALAAMQPTHAEDVEAALAASRAHMLDGTRRRIQSMRAAALLPEAAVEQATSLANSHRTIEPPAALLQLQ